MSLVQRRSPAGACGSASQGRLQKVLAADGVRTRHVPRAAWLLGTRTGQERSLGARQGPAEGHWVQWESVGAGGERGCA